MEQVRAALARPPRTTEEVGYSVSGQENEFENYFRKVTNVLSGTPFATQAEDKYIYEIFEQWVAPGRLSALPNALKQSMPLVFGTLTGAAPENEAAMAQRVLMELKAHFTEGVMAVEKAFDALGSPLLTLDLGGGDTLPFINVTPAAARRWRDIELGVSHDRAPMGVRSPMWGAFLDHLCYALGLNRLCSARGLSLEEQLPSLPPQPPMRALATAMQSR